MNKQEIFTKSLTSNRSNESNTEETIKIIKELSRYKDHIFRGENKNYGKVSSKLYRKYQGTPLLAKRSVLEIQQDLIESARPHIRPDASDIEVLTELQHYGGKTALIDFTTNAYIALFFACYGEFSEDDEDGEFSKGGRIIVLKKPAVLPAAIQDNDQSLYRIQPSGKSPRVIFQSSVFVQVATGYLEKGSEEDRYEVINIKQEQKIGILAYLKQICGIDADTVYNDIHGFIQNQDDRTIAETEFFTGKACFEDKEYDQAIEHYDNAIESNPNFIEAFYNRGIAYTKKGEDDLAITDYTEAIALRPDYAIAFYNRGHTYNEKGEYELAIADYSKAIELTPDDAEAFYNRGVAYENKGEYDPAIVDYSKAIALKSDNAEAFCNRGVAYARKSEFDKAISDCNQAIALRPDYAPAFNNRGIAYKSKGEYELAITDYTQAIALKPDYAEAFVNRGNVYAQKGEHDPAITDYTQAIALKSDFAGVFCSRGIAYKSKGEYDLAIADVTRAIQLFTQQGEMDLANKAKLLLQELTDKD